MPYTKGEWIVFCSVMFVFFCFSSIFLLIYDKKMDENQARIKDAYSECVWMYKDLVDENPDFYTDGLIEVSVDDSYYYLEFQDGSIEASVVKFARSSEEEACTVNDVMNEYFVHVEKLTSNDYPSLPDNVTIYAFLEKPSSPYPGAKGHCSS